jgi:hypothetical protein
MKCSGCFAMKEQEQYIRDNIASIAEEAFPDNIGNEWIIHNILEHPEGIEVEVEPRPSNGIWLIKDCEISPRSVF